MDTPKDIYDRPRQLERIMKRIDRQIESENTKNLLHDFEAWLVSQGLSTARITRYLECMLWIAEHSNGNELKNPDSKWTIAILNAIEAQKWQEWTKYGFKTTIRKFFNYLDRKDLLDLVKANPPKKKKLPEELLSKEEIERMIEVAEHPRDKALIALLYETGARITEIALLQIKHITFDELGAVVILANGKTGMRRVRIVYAASYLRQWIDSHPVKNPDAALWVNKGDTHKPLKYLAFRKVLVQAGARAGIKKRIYLHLTRHSRATHLAQHLTEQQMKNYLGWTQGSAMAAVYVSLSGKDMDNAVLKMYGMQKEEDMIDPMKPDTCPRCKELNPQNAKFCYKCGMPLDVETASDLKTKEDEFLIGLMSLLKTNPQFLDSIKDAARNRNTGGVNS